MTHLEIARKFYEEVLGQGKVELMDELVHENAQITTGLSPMGPIDGRDNYKQTFAQFRDAFPHVKLLEILEMFESADGTRVVTRFHSHQRHEKEYFGLAPTHRVILFDETQVMKIEKGLIVENVVSATNLEFEMLMAPVLSPMILK